MQTLLLPVIYLCTILQASIAFPAPGYYLLVAYRYNFHSSGYVTTGDFGHTLRADGVLSQSELFLIEPGRFANSFRLSFRNCRNGGGSRFIGVFTNAITKHSQLVDLEDPEDPLNSEFFAFFERTKDGQSLYTIKMAEGRSPRSWWGVDPRTSTISIGYLEAAAYFAFIPISPPRDCDQNFDGNEYYEECNTGADESHDSPWIGSTRNNHESFDEYSKGSFLKAATKRDSHKSARKHPRGNARTTNFRYRDALDEAKNEPSHFDSPNPRKKKASDAKSFSEPENPVPNARYDPKKGETPKTSKESTNTPDDSYSDAGCDNEEIKTPQPVAKENPEIARILALDRFALSDEYEYAVFNYRLNMHSPKSEIGQVYRSLAKAIHPDKHRMNKDRATRAFQILQEAYELLLSHAT